METTSILPVTITPNALEEIRQLFTDSAPASEAQQKKKKHAKKASIDANGEKVIGNLLLNEDDELQNATAS